MAGGGRGNSRGEATHSRSCDEVWKLPQAPVQDGLLDPFHVQEQSGIHGSGSCAAQAEIISPREGTQAKTGICPGEGCKLAE